MKSKITAVLPTHNREVFLERAGLFYRDAPFEIVVVDSSHVPYEGLMPSCFRYHHQADWAFGAKLAFGFAQVRTPFCIMINDDDFFFDRAIEKEVEFLERNTRYASAQGFYMLKWPIEKARRIGPQYLNRLAFHIDGETALDRMLQLVGNYMHTSYSVHRTEHMQNIMLRVPQILSPFAIEFLVAFGSIAAGKHIMLPHLHCIREVVVGSSGADKTGFYGLSKLPSRMREYSYALYALQTLVRDSMGFDNDAAFEMVDRITPDPLVPRTPGEKKGPPIGAWPDCVAELSPDTWKSMMSTSLNVRLRATDDELHRFLSACERWKTSGGDLPRSFRTTDVG